ncbi:MAG: A/G-specific adenine glycosylase [Candidatus Accumulibacter phosphatis]|uniref:Adenine DNA glycosylase n=2 Tax=Candidatus Accumulibacter TaxID=327159 RepID=A0A080M3G5_9PROT|nr:MAG: A/G-specific adenine glycosylase [Candidatus Accumulibacter phosphatis]
MRVIRWQMANGRHDLPWQQTRDAYRIWLSETMLQQTRVQTVIPYYARFLACFPTLEALAEAPLESVLELWSGLGYYARARNLHRCAKTIVTERAGKFSADPVETAGLPGIGRSTAAAISVFAFGRRAAILDGNVKRVLARCFGVASGDSPAQQERSMWALAEVLLPENDIEAYTQGMMDLGATICLRSKPVCDACPLQPVCVACREGRQAELPRPTPRKALPERTTSVLLLSDGRRVFLERRPPSGIWGGLLCLPEAISESATSFARRQGCRLLGTQALPPITHAFTHFRLTLQVLRCDVEVISLQARENGCEWLPLDDVAGAALPTPIKKLLLSLDR